MSYIVPAKNAEYEFCEKRSRFTGRIYKIETAEEAQEILAALRKKYWDATHHVYAYILHSGTERFSDDGEPSGTSGMPTLTVLRGAGVENVMCVTTRYFGGTLLGAGGLVRAYSQAAKGALENAGLARMTPFDTVEVVCYYPLLQPLRYAFPQLNIIEKDCQYGEKVTLTLALEPQYWDNALRYIQDLSGGSVMPRILGQTLVEKPI